MTKFRWNDPPNEHDPANYNPDRDPKLTFIEKTDGQSVTERQAILNRLIEIDDLLKAYQAGVDPSPFVPGFLLGHDLRRYEELNDFDPSLKGTDEDTLAAKKISSLKAEQLELIERLAAFPRRDRF